MSIAEIISIAEYAVFMFLVGIPIAGILGVLIGTVLGFSLGFNQDGNQRSRR